MLKKVSFKKSEIKLGEKLPWAVYRSDGTLLLREGTVVSSQRQLDIVLEKGMYRGATRQEVEQEEKKRLVSSKQTEQPKKYFSDNIFKLKLHCAKQTEELLTAMVTSHHVDVVAETGAIFELIDRACHDDSNAALAAVHLAKDFSYSVLHPLHTAILCKILIQRLSFSETQQRSIVSAALTMNVGMYELQEVLFAQKEALSLDQKKAILAHPQKSVEILGQYGVEDRAWLDMILQHHERVNGNGYPAKKKAEEIHQGAKIIALADVYAAMITPRIYRKPIAAKEALKETFTKRGEEVDEKLAQMLIAEVGIFPPGSFVSLENGELGIVIKRAMIHHGEKTSPAVCSIMSPRGGRYERFIMRDTSDKRYAIKAACQPEFEDPIDYPSLWGYS